MAPCKTSNPGDRHKIKPRDRHEKKEKDMKKKVYAHKGGKKHG